MAIFMGCVYFYGISHYFSNRLLPVIILTMIGPEARKVDHIKEHEAQFREDISSDHSGDKIQDNTGHGEKISDEHVESNVHQERRSEATLDDIPPKSTEKEIA